MRTDLPADTRVADSRVHKVPLDPVQARLSGSAINMSANLDSTNLQGTWTTASAPGQSLPLWLYRRLLRTLQTFPTAGMNGGRNIVQTQYNVTIGDGMLTAVYGAFITLPPHLLRRLREMPEADMQPRPMAAVGGIMQPTTTVGNSSGPSTTDSRIPVSNAVADTTASLPPRQPRISPSTRRLDINALLARPAVFPPSRQTGTARKSSSGVKKQPPKTNQRRTRTSLELSDASRPATSSSGGLTNEPQRSPPPESHHIPRESPDVTTNEQRHALLSNPVVYQTEDDDTGPAASLEDPAVLPLPLPEPLLRRPDTPIHRRRLASPAAAANDQGQPVLSDTVIHRTKIGEGELVTGLNDPFNQRPLSPEQPLRTPPLPALEREDPESLFIPEDHQTGGSEPATGLDDALPLPPFSPERPLRTPSPVREDDDANSIFVTQGSRQRARQGQRHRGSGRVPNNGNHDADGSSLTPVLESGPDHLIDQQSPPNSRRGLDGYQSAGGHYRSTQQQGTANPIPSADTGDEVLDSDIDNHSDGQGTALQGDESHDLEDPGTPTPLPVQRLADEYHTTRTSCPNTGHDLTTSLDSEPTDPSIYSGQLSSTASLPLDYQNGAHWGGDETSSSGNALSSANDQEASSTDPLAEVETIGTPSVDNIILVVDDSVVMDGSDVEVEADRDTVSDTDVDTPDADDLQVQGGSDPGPDVHAQNAGTQTENPEPPLQPGALSRDPYGALMVLRRLLWNGELRWVPAPRERSFSPPRQPRPVPPEQGEWRDYPGIVAALRRFDANIAARCAREARQATGDADDCNRQGNETIVVTRQSTSNDDDSGQQRAPRTTQRRRGRATTATSARSHGRRRAAGPTRGSRGSAGRTTNRQRQTRIDHARAAAEQRAQQANEDRQGRLERRRRLGQEMHRGSDGDGDGDGDEDRDCGDSVELEGES